MRHCILLLSVVFLSALSLLAQEEQFPEYNHRIGAAASSISGAGLSYMYSFTPDFRGKLTGFVYYDAASDDDRQLAGSFGIECQMDVHQSSWTRLYVLGGASIWYNDERYYSTSVFDEQAYISYRSSDIERMYTAGIGIGIEMVVWKHVLFNLDGGYQFRRTTEDYNSYRHNANGDVIYGRVSVPTSRNYIGFGGGIGVCYAF